MSQPLHHASTRTDTIRFDILVSDGFVLTEPAGVVDTLRIMNRVTPSDRFAFRYLSRHGGRVPCRAALEVETAPVPDKPEVDYLVVIGNSSPAAPGLSVQDIVRRYTHRGAKVVLLAEAASRHIGETAPDSAHTTHWENSAILGEGRVTIDPKFALAVEDGVILTCAGMGATVGLMLALLNHHVPTSKLMAGAGILLHDRIRDCATPIRSCVAPEQSQHSAFEHLAVDPGNRYRLRFSGRLVWPVQGHVRHHAATNPGSEKPTDLTFSQVEQA